MSDLISVNRSLPDMRHRKCREEVYQPVLPATTVIVCFHNEAWSVLIRTVHSILNRSPPHLIHDIILVDDFSDMDILKVFHSPFIFFVWKINALVACYNIYRIYSICISLELSLSHHILCRCETAPGPPIKALLPGSAQR